MAKNKGKIAYLLNTNSVVISITPSQLKVKNEKVKPPFSTKFSHEISIYWSERISHIKFDISSRNKTINKLKDKDTIIIFTKLSHWQG